MNKLKNSLLNSFCYAVSGILNCISNERNFRIHIVVSAYVLFFSRYFSLDRTDFVILCVSIMFVLVCEMLNTSIESVVNYLSPDYNIHAKIAKDVAAGAVLLSAVFSIIIGLILFFKIDIIKSVIVQIISNPLYLLLLAISLIISWLFIFAVKFDKPTKGSK